MDQQLLIKLLKARAVSGDEEEVKTILRQQYQSLGLEIITDQLGSVFGLKKGTTRKHKVLVIAHQDEVGFVIKGHTDQGLLTFACRGGINKDIIPGTKVVTVIDGCRYYGVILTIPPHLKEINDKSYLIDCGFSCKEEAQVIKEGTTFTFDSEPVIKDNILISKAIDDRLGCFMGIELLRRLNQVSVDYDLYVGASTQEEVGLRGAESAIKLIKPDLAIIVDCSPASDCYGPNGEFGFLGKGLLIRFFDPGMIPWRTLIDLQKEAADQCGANYQYYLSLGGTDAGIIHKSLCGIPTLTHCLCARYIHSANAICDLRDYKAALDCLETIIKRLDANCFEQIYQERRGR